MTAPVLSPDERAAREAVICHLRSAGYVGRGFDGLTRVAFDELAEQAFLRAEAECRGELVCPAGRAQDIDPRSLFRGPRVRAERWASEELLRHWEVVGRLSYDEYVADLIASGLDEVGANERTCEETVTTVEATVTPIKPEPRSATALLLDENVSWLTRFVALPSAAERDACALWAAATHARDAKRVMVWDALARVAVTSDMPQSGKSTLGRILAGLSFNGKVFEDPSGPGVLQMIHEHQRTVVIDEFDVLIGKGAGSSMLRAILNGGAYRDGTIIRRDHEDSSWGAMVTVGIGQVFRTHPMLAATRTRCIEVAMRPRPDGVELDKFRGRLHGPLLQRLSAAWTAWGRKYAGELADSWPAMPDGIADRAQDMWEPLIAVADLAGGDWPERARAACRALALSEVDESEEPPRSPLQQLLVDAEAAFRGEDRIPSGQLCERLGERGWPLECDRASAMELARLLEPAEVEPTTIRVGDRTPKGYLYANVAAARDVFVPDVATVASVATSCSVATSVEDDFM